MAFGFIGVIIGIILLLIGIFNVFFFSMSEEHTGYFDDVAVVLGFIFMIVGGALIFLP